MTGASGYIASVLCAELQARGHHVRGTVRDVERFQKEEVFRGVALYQATLLDKSSFEAAFAGCDCVMQYVS